MRLVRAVRRLVVVLMLMIAGTAHAQQRLGVNATGNVPLMFGMNVEQVSQALGVPLNYVRGRDGNELYVALPNVKGTTLSSRSDGLYLQFRKGRLSGWKGDWGTIRP
jgi:hypothetical protein